jgi:hypothetical protein
VQELTDHEKSKSRMRMIVTDNLDEVVLEHGVRNAGVDLQSPPSSVGRRRTRSRPPPA